MKERETKTHKTRNEKRESKWSEKKQLNTENKNAQKA